MYSTQESVPLFEGPLSIGTWGSTSFYSAGSSGIVHLATKSVKVRALIDGRDQNLMSNLDRSIAHFMICPNISSR